LALAISAEIPAARTGLAKYLARVARNYLANIDAYRRDSVSVLDFLRVMQVRLALSKVGRLICPSPITAKVRLRTFGSGPLALRSHTTDISVLNEILVSGGYDALLRHPVRDPRLIVDLGANTGLVDRWLLERYPGSKIVAVEPEPGNYACLVENVAGLAVKTVPAAIGAQERMILLHTSSGEHGFTMVGEPALGSRAVEVPVVTMASILDGAEVIDLLKVDIEGAEEELFADCASWIGKVQMLLVECHGHYKLKNLTDALNRAGVNFKLLEVDLKSELGFEVGLFERA
jgi:FkbM family methyltransferase